MNWRMFSLLSFFVLLYGALVYQLYILQVKNGAWYVTLAEGRQEIMGALAPSRGSIYFTDKDEKSIPVALNKEYSIVYAVPKELVKEEAEGGRKITEAVSLLSPFLGDSVSGIKERLSRKTDEYELLISKVPPQAVDDILSLEIKGIYARAQDFRFYPFGSLGSHILGFVSLLQEGEKNSSGAILTGRYGIEQYFDKTLSGVAAIPRGDRVVRVEDGDDVHLTIDRTVQMKGEEILGKLVSEFRSPGGTFIVEDPMTGKILAMGNSPSFDPNDFSKSGVKNFLNPAVQAVYEPGSIFKVITMSAGIDSGKITPDTAYSDSGSVTLSGKTLTNWDFKTHGGYGKITMTGVIEHSINTGAVYAERKMGHDIFKDYLAKFGLNQTTGIELPGEIKGSIKNLDRGRDVDFATASFGQGVSVTPLALINGVSAIANGGLLMKPFIDASLKPEVVRRVISGDTANKVTQMMASAVVKNKLAAIPGYTIAGKTGTAFVPDFGKNRYTDSVINTFVGFAPAAGGDPKFIILIKLDRPAGSPLAGQTVVPAFREFARFLLNYYSIPPDQAGNQ